MPRARVVFVKPSSFMNSQRHAGAADLVVVPHAAGATCSSSATTWTCRSASCACGRSAATAATTACARSSPRSAKSFRDLRIGVGRPEYDSVDHVLELRSTTTSGATSRDRRRRGRRRRALARRRSRRRDAASSIRGCRRRVRNETPCLRTIRQSGMVNAGPVRPERRTP